MGRGVNDHVLEHLSQAVQRDLNHVDGEIEDEDGDWATEFIVADPLPRCLPPRQSSPSQSTSLGLFPSEADASFICNACTQYLPLHTLVPDLKCSCLCCTQCLKHHIELLLLQQCSELRSLGPEGMLLPLPCPFCECEAAISSSAMQSIAPEACKVLEEKASQVFFEAADYIQCPSCNMLIEKVAGDIPPGVAPSGVPEFDRTAPFTELDDNGKPLSRVALFDKYNNYYRCSLCKHGFCGLCMSVPYHLGHTCKEFKEFQNAKRCLYCDTPVLWNDASKGVQANSLTVRQLQSRLDKEGVDSSWCVEKGDLLSVLELVSNVCDSKDCKKYLQNACTRKLECGHQCGGIRGERTCLPCLNNVCRENVLLLRGCALPSADDWCTICMVESLCTCPSIQLKCGHVLHFECAKKKVKEGFAGPEITFGFLRCPQCSEFMEHESLENVLRKPLELFSMVKEKAVKRARMEKPKTSMTSEELEAYALNKYNYYLCCKCQSPYYGGNHDCRLGLEAGGARNIHNPLDLVCGGCSAAEDAKMVCSKGHGTKYIEYKCKYCCSVATFFCFGRTHFCSNCHLTRPDGNPDYIPPPCRGPQYCPLKVAHAPNGQECCLGCSMCRILSQ